MAWSRVASAGQGCHTKVVLGLEVAFNTAQHPVNRGDIPSWLGGLDGGLSAPGQALNGEAMAGRGLGSIDPSLALLERRN